MDASASASTNDAPTTNTTEPSAHNATTPVAHPLPWLAGAIADGRAGWLAAWLHGNGSGSRCVCVKGMAVAHAHFLAAVCWTWEQLRLRPPLPLPLPGLQTDCERQHPTPTQPQPQLQPQPAGLAPAHANPPSRPANVNDSEPTAKAHQPADHPPARATRPAVRYRTHATTWPPRPAHSCCIRRSLETIFARIAPRRRTWADNCCSGQRSQDPPYLLQGQGLQEAHPAQGHPLVIHSRGPRCTY